MQSKSLLIAIAAFALTTTGAQAYVSNIDLLSSEQQAAFAEARELKEKGEIEKARDVLVKAGIDEETISTLRKANKNSRNVISAAVEENDYEAFREAAKNSPLLDIITTKSDFELFVKAHDLKKDGNLKEAKEILDDLGLPQKSHGHFIKNVHNNKHHKELISELSEKQREALRVAREANDKETVKAILKEAGINDFSNRKHQTR
jgi:hypothetical protein